MIEATATMTTTPVEMITTKIDGINHPITIIETKIGTGSAKNGIVFKMSRIKLKTKEGGLITRDQ